MEIHTPSFLEALLFMKGEAVDGIDDIARISPHQVHGTEIVCVTDSNYAVNHPDADGVLLMTSKASASLRFADCAPVMLWGTGWVMILHSGFKGTVQNIVRKGIELVKNSASGASGAWIGPCIGFEHYCRELSDEWTLRGMQSFHSANFEGREGKIYFNLAGEIRSQLIECGMSSEDIALSGIDTFTDKRCYSYRRGDKFDRMTLYVKLIERADV